MKSWKEEFEQYLPEVESFLTSVLLGDTKVTLTSSETKESEAALSALQKTDIFLLTRDKTLGADIILVLDQEWYAILSKTMLGTEENSSNEITRDLLKKFSGELSETLLKKLSTDGVSTDLEEIQVLALAQAHKEIKHSEYLLMHFEVDGVGDKKLRAEMMVGNPKLPLGGSQDGAGTAAVNDDSETNNTEAESDFRPTAAAEMERMSNEQETISGQKVEFDDFEEGSPAYKNGGVHSMDLLKDVEMDVSVELGRIQMPLGKVLQLSKGSVIELEKLAGEPADILVNGQCIAYGEVVVIDEHFGVRISNLVTTRQRLAGIK